jgi:hypothetical protein
MDLNKTTTIITEATQATEALQKKFEVELNQSNEISPSIEINNSELIPSEVIMVVEADNTLHKVNILENNQTNTTLKNIDMNLSSENNDNKASSCYKRDNNNTKECQEEETEGKMIRGLIIFKTRIKPFCDMTGEEFAKQYAQEDWDDMYHEKTFKKEIFRACPRIEKRYKDKWTPHLYEFTLEYASDSEAIPEC